MLHGPVLLAWNVARNNALHPERGHNLVFHEFAHKIDMRSGEASGQPPLTKVLAAEWRHVMGSLLAALRSGDERIVDTYGATNPAELMAVCTEAFFVMPRHLHEEHPDLYRLFQAFYRQDPASRED
jgi:Mlc titration factor MtfA (ptsG expression regulator)